MKNVPLTFLCFALITFAQTQSKTAAQTSAASAQLPSKETVDSFLQHMFGYDAKITWRILNIKPSIVHNMAEIIVVLGDSPTATHLYISPDGKYAIPGEALPFGADPFAQARNELHKRATGPSQGAQEATVTIVEFSDLECPHCKQAHPIIEKLIKDSPAAKWVFQNFPLEQIHPWALQAAEYADCIGRSDTQAFWKFTTAVFDNQENIKPENAVDLLKKLTNGSGADAQRVSACAAEEQTADNVQKSVALGTSLGVTATPTLFINGRKIANLSGTPYDVLKHMVEFAATEAKPSSAQ